MSNMTKARPDQMGGPSFTQGSSLPARYDNTDGQLDLISLLCGPPPLAERFRRFHHDNPAVYRVLVTLAREWVRRTGRDRLSIAMLVERARWEIALTTNDPDFKINNSYKPFYARLIMEHEPDLRGMFEVRRSVADRTAVSA